MTDIDVDTFVAVIAGALEIARYAMTYGLTMPVGRRPTPCLLAEEVTLAAQRLLAAKQPVELANLLDTIALTERTEYNINLPGGVAPG